MRDERTLPFRPLRDLASEARLAVERSRARRVDASDKTLYVRTDQPSAPRFGDVSDNSASLLWAGVIAALLTWIAALALCLLA